MRSRLRLTLLAVALIALMACTEPATMVRGDRLDGSEIIVLGDWGSGTEAQEQVARAMAEYSADRDIAAIVTTGDNFYNDDVDDLMEPYEWVARRDIPWVVSWGNHDLDTPRRVELMEETFDGAPRWVLHDWGQVDIVVLDSTQIDESEQVGFLDLALSESDDPSIVVFHHPPYSCGSHGGDHEILERWVSRFDDDVFLVLNGHEHNYQRFEDERVTYLVTGGGGRFLTQLATCAPDHPERQAGAMTHHFVTMRLSDVVELSAIDTDGNVIDELVLDLP